MTNTLQCLVPLLSIILKSYLLINNIWVLRQYNLFFRDIAEEMLQIAMPGTFFIRDSSSNPGFFALSMKVPHAVRESGIANILIEREPNGYFRMPVSCILK